MRSRKRNDASRSVGSMFVLTKLVACYSLKPGCTLGDEDDDRVRRVLDNSSPDAGGHTVVKARDELEHRSLTSDVLAILGLDDLDDAVGVELSDRIDRAADQRDHPFAYLRIWDVRARCSRLIVEAV